jgi:general secretion pathway protein F
MPAFRYRAANAEGKTTTGVIEADHAKHARQLLKQQQLIPLELTPLASSDGSSTSSLGASLGISSGSRPRRRIKQAELVLLTRQLASLIAAQLPIEQALSAVIEQAERPPVAEVLAGVRTHLLEGQSLATALTHFSADFPDIYRALIAAGEQSGHLGEILLKLADYIEARQALQQKMLGAALYPIIVSVVALLVIVGLLTYVVPQVVQVFVQTKQKLPLLTVILIAISDFLRHWGWLVATTVAASAMSFRYALRRPAFKLAWHRRLLGQHLLGRLLLGVDTTRFASTLAILVGSGVPLLAALTAGANTISNVALKQTVQDAMIKVREGMGLAKALALSKQFPPMLIHLIRSGEATGQLPQLLQKAAETQANELERRTLMLTSLLEPLLILSMGVFVLLIVLAVLLPIIEINQLVR